MYNSLLILKFSNRTKVIAFADDLIVLTRGACKNETTLRELVFKEN